MKKSIAAGALALLAATGCGTVRTADAAPKACRGHVVRVAYGARPTCDVRPPQVLVTTFPTFDGDEHAKVVAICEDLGGYPVRVRHHTAECRVDY